MVRKKSEPQSTIYRRDVCLIVIYDGRVLLGEKRKSSHEDRVWDLPGGRCNSDETYQQCGLRETREETGLSVKIIDKAPCAETVDEYPTGKKENTLIYRAKPIRFYEPKTIEKEKFYQWAYFPWNELPDKISLCLRNLKRDRFDPFKK